MCHHFLHSLKTLMIPLTILLLTSIAPVPGTAAERQMLWESREQFVALEPRETEGNNNHPTEIDQNRLRVQLGALRLQPTANEKAIPLFTNDSLTSLVEHLQQGLRQASPRQDVTFAVIGLHDALYGLAKQPQVTTGRLFVQNGRLNLIVGIAHREVKDREDRRLNPFTPGSRLAKASEPWQILIPTEAAGMLRERQNWIAIPLDWKNVAAPGPATSQLPQPSALALPVRTPAERLIIIKELHDKGLITDSEFQSKRREILQEL